MSDSELPGQLPPRRSRAIRRPPAGGGEPPAETPAPQSEPLGEPPTPPATPLFTGRSTPREPVDQVRGPQLGPTASATRAAFPSKPSADEPRRRSDPTLDAPILRVPPAASARSSGPVVAVLLGLGLLGGALALAWPSGSPRQLTTVVTPAPTPPPAPVVYARTPDKPVYNPWAGGKRPVVRRSPRPVLVADPEPAPEPEATPEPRPATTRPRPVVPAQPPPVAHSYPQARPKPTPPPLVNSGYYDPYADPYYAAPPVPAPAPSRSLDMRVTSGVVIGGSEPLKAYSLSLLVHNRSQERVERLRVVLRRGAQSFETTNFNVLEPGQRQELQLAFSGVPKKFHPQRLEVHWSTFTGDFVSEKPVSDSAWAKASSGGY